MPRGDRTGPTGMGPMSGRGAGYCAQNQTPGFMNRFFGRGSGAGFRRNSGGGYGGFGWRNMFRSTGLPGWMRFGGGYGPQTDPNSKTDKRALESQVDFLKSQLEQLQQRLNELESRDAGK